MKEVNVVIVGGGFGGLTAAKALSRSGVKVTLVDKKNYHLFQPLLYQVAMAALSPAEIAYPLRAMLKHNAEVLLGEVTEINKEEKWIKTDANKIYYDYLILACGSTYTYFNSPQWEKFAPTLKTISQATEIRRRVFLAFEQAEREATPEKRKPYLTFVIVGGGPTGVELAGSLGEITRYSITKDFDHINPSDTEIILIEAGPRILAGMPEDLSREAERQLKELGVVVHTNARVSNLDENGISIGDTFIPSATILWAAGVAASPLNKTLGTELDRQGRIIVNSDLTIPNHPEIYVIGDQAHYKWGEKNEPLPGLAPVAMQQGRFAARSIRMKINHQTPPAFFKYTDKGQMATVGRSRAVAMYNNLHFTGFIAWMAWLFVHIFYLIGFRNRIFVLLNWAWTYLTYRRGARLIIDKN